MASKTLAKEKVNFVRCCGVAEDLFPKTLRDLLYSGILPMQILYTAQTKHKSDLVAKVRNPFTLGKHQWSLLNSASVRGYIDFDTTLLYTLIRNLLSPTFCPAPSNGWGNPPNNPGQITLGDDVERIRTLRNEVYGHTKKTEMSDADFNIYWKLFEDICQRLDNNRGNNDYTNELLEISSIDFLPKKLSDYVDCIQKQLEADDYLTKEVQTLKEEIRDIDRRIKTFEDDATNRPFERLVDISKTSMKGFLSHCEYIETRAFQAVMKKIKEHRLVLIIVRPGDGKTTLGYQTLTTLESKGFQPLLFRSDDFDKGVCTERNKLAILFDDVFGVYTLSKQEVGIWSDSRNQYQLYGFLGSGNYAIFVIRKEIYIESNAETIFSLLSIDNVVDLTDEESYSLTIEEKKKLLKTIPGMTDDTIHLLESITINDEVGFPQCVRLMKKCDVSKEDSTISLLSTPIQHMRRQINCFNKEMCEKFFILTMAYSNDGSFQSTSMKENADNLPEEVKIEPSSYRTIRNIADSLCGSYLIYEKLEDRYILSHESIIEALALTIYADLKYKEKYINMSPLRFLQKLDYHCDSEYFLPRHLYSVLFKRLSEMMGSGDKDEYLSSVSVRLFKDPDAARQFSDFLKSENLITKTTSEGLTILVYAASNGNHILVQHLLRFVSDDDQILFATQKAARYSNLQSVNDLLDRTREDIGLDTLFYAIKGGNSHIFTLLLQRIKREILSSTKVCNVKLFKK